MNKLKIKLKSSFHNHFILVLFSEIKLWMIVIVEKEIIGNVNERQANQTNANRNQNNRNN